MAALHLPFRSTPGLVSSTVEPGYLGGQTEAYKPGFVLSYEDPRSHGGAQSQVQEGLSRG